MKILFLGDIFGSIGRDMVYDYLPRIKQKYGIDFVIGNSENVTHGKGLNKRHYQELIFHGVQALTMGNHTYSKREIYDYIDEADRLIVPQNRQDGLPGVGSRLFDIKGKKIRVTNLLGVAFMDPETKNPFYAIDEVLKNKDWDYHIVDFHGEATSEKIVFASYVDGRVDAVLGTHTHVPTADASLLPKGTLFISDVGMCGPIYSAIGCDLSVMLRRLKDQEKVPFTLAQGRGMLNAVILTLDQEHRKIEHLHIEEGDLL